MDNAKEEPFAPDKYILKTLNVPVGQNKLKELLLDLQNDNQNWSTNDLNTLDFQRETVPETWILAYLSALAYVEQEGDVIETLDTKLWTKEIWKVWADGRKKAGESAIKLYLNGIGSRLDSKLIALEAFEKTQCAVFWRAPKSKPLRKTQLIFAFRGTSSFSRDADADIKSVAFQKKTCHLNEACTLVLHYLTTIESKFKDNVFPAALLEVIITGHSLGGYLAQIATYAAKYLRYKENPGGHCWYEKVGADHCHPRCRVFDSPGAADMINYIEMAFRHGIGRSLYLDIVNTVISPNGVNVINHHFGSLMKFQSPNIEDVEWNIPDDGIITLFKHTSRSHGIQLFCKFLDPKHFVPLPEVSKKGIWAWANDCIWWCLAKGFKSVTTTMENYHVSDPVETVEVENWPICIFEGPDTRPEELREGLFSEVRTFISGLGLLRQEKWGTAAMGEFNDWKHSRAHCSTWNVRSDCIMVHKSRISNEERTVLQLIRKLQLWNEHFRGSQTLEGWKENLLNLSESFCELERHAIVFKPGAFTAVQNSVHVLEKFETKISGLENYYIVKLIETGDRALNNLYQRYNKPIFSNNHFKPSAEAYCRVIKGPQSNIDLICLKLASQWMTVADAILLVQPGDIEDALMKGKWTTNYRIQAIFVQTGENGFQEDTLIQWWRQLKNKNIGLIALIPTTGIPTDPSWMEIVAGAEKRFNKVPRDWVSLNDDFWKDTVISRNVCIQNRDYCLGGFNLQMPQNQLGIAEICCLLDNDTVIDILPPPKSLVDGYEAYSQPGIRMTTSELLDRYKTNVDMREETILLVVRETSLESEEYLKSLLHFPNVQSMVKTVNSTTAQNTIELMRATAKENKGCVVDLFIQQVHIDKEDEWLFLYHYNPNFYLQRTVLIPEPDIPKLLTALSHVFGIERANNSELSASVLHRGKEVNHWWSTPKKATEGYKTQLTASEKQLHQTIFNDVECEQRTWESLEFLDINNDCFTAAKKEIHLLFNTDRDRHEFSCRPRAITDAPVEVSQGTIFEGRRAVLLCDQPGMGKSATALKLCEKLMETYTLVAYVPLGKLSPNFYHSNLKHDALDILFKIISLNQESPSDVSTLVLKKILENKGGFDVALVLDGFDEIQQVSQSSAVQLIQELLAKTNAKIIITGRNEVEDLLYDRLTLLPYMLKNLSIESETDNQDNERLYILCTMWNSLLRSSSGQKQLIKSFASAILHRQTAVIQGNDDLFGVPLQLRMLTEIFAPLVFECVKDLDTDEGNCFATWIKEKLPASFTFTNLYRLYFERKYDIYWLKREIISQQLGGIGQFGKKFLAYLALSELNLVRAPPPEEDYFTEKGTPEKLKNWKTLYELTYGNEIYYAEKEDFSEISGLGLVTIRMEGNEGIDGLRHTFLHRTIAEYLVAKFLFNEIIEMRLYRMGWRMDDYFPLLNRVVKSDICRPSFYVVRLFINEMIGENSGMVGNLQNVEMEPLELDELMNQHPSEAGSGYTGLESIFIKCVIEDGQHFLVAFLINYLRLSQKALGDVVVGRHQPEEFFCKTFKRTRAYLVLFSRLRNTFKQPMTLCSMIEARVETHACIDDGRSPTRLQHTPETISTNNRVYTFFKLVTVWLNSLCGTQLQHDLSVLSVIVLSSCHEEDLLAAARVVATEWSDSFTSFPFPQLQLRDEAEINCIQKRNTLLHNLQKYIQENLYVEVMQADGTCKELFRYKITKLDKKRGYHWKWLRIYCQRREN